MNVRASLVSCGSVVIYGALAIGCASAIESHSAKHPAQHPAQESARSEAPAHSAPDGELAQVAAIHGGAGPWVVAGYRMGAYALKELGLPRFSFDLDVKHHTPHEVQYSCIADGAAASTGASVGKLNLTLVDADAAHVATTYRRKSTGREITLRTTAPFAARFLNVPRERLGDAGREVASLKDEDIFEVVPQN